MVSRLPGDSPPNMTAPTLAVQPAIAAEWSGCVDVAELFGDGCMTGPSLLASVAFCIALGTAPISAHAQAEGVVRPVGHPERVATEQALTDVRTFAVARAGDRVLVVYVQANDPYARGQLRTALLREAPDRALQREGTDRTLAPGALALAVSWDGHSGAVVYTVPRPHRGEAPGAHRPRTGGRDRALADPLGPAALTAADVMFQRIDENGAPVGRAVLAFEENSRAFRVAIGRDGENWQLAWTGGLSIDDEIQGTVRTMRVTAQGVPRSFASETGFTGQVGDVLRVVPAGGARHDATVIFTGERCVSHEHEPPNREPAIDPSAAIESHPRALLPQQPPHEHVGPPIVCDGWQIFAAPLHADGATGPIVAGPVLSRDALAVIDPRDPMRLVAPLDGGLTAFDLDPLGHAAHATLLGDALLPGATRAASIAPSDAEPTSALATTPSRIAPPMPPDAPGMLRVPAAFDAARIGDGLAVFALSPSHQRAVFGSFGAAGGAGTLVLTAPAPLAFDVALAAGERSDPWLFAQTGAAVGGPLVFLRGDASALHAAPPEMPWPGDERFVQQMLRARAARAAYTAVEGVFGPLSERPDAATNPHLAGLAAGLRRLRGPWDLACESLQERARFLARHGADADITQLAAMQCELPPEPVIPGTPGAPPIAPQP